VKVQLRDFDISLLVTLEALWSSRSVSAAAKSLNLAQSTVSAALNRLRQSLDDELFTWSGTEMIPTPLVEQLMPDVGRVLDGARAVLERSLGPLSGVERRLVIATADYVVALLGPQLLKRAAVEAPKLSFDFIDMRPRYINKATRPDVDLFIIPGGALRVSGLDRQLLYQDSYVCIAAADNRALGENMSGEEFLKLRHVGYSALPRTVFNHETMLWDDLNVEPTFQLTMGNYLIFPRIVANSDAVAILPKRLARTLVGEWKIKWIEPPLPTPRLEIHSLWRPAQSQDPALAWLREAISEITSDWSD
jgi:LysR family transcriptional regulator, nod-box dependent transcriptional activator